MLFHSKKWPKFTQRLGGKLRVFKTLQFTFTAQITFVIILLFSIGNVIIFRTTSERLIRNTHLRNRPNHRISKQYKPVERINCFANGDTKQAARNFKT